MARTTTTTIEPSARVFATSGGPTIDQLRQEGSPWYLAPELLETYLELAADLERIMGHLQAYRTGDSMYRYHERVRHQSRLRGGLDPDHDARGDKVDYRELDQRLPRHPEVASSEAFYVHLEIETEARRLVDQAADAAKARAQHVRTHTCRGCGQVHPHTDHVRVLDYAGANRFQLCPRCAEAARRIVAEQQLAGTHVDGQPVRDVLAALVADQQ